MSTPASGVVIAAGFAARGLVVYGKAFAPGGLWFNTLRFGPVAESSLAAYAFESSAALVESLLDRRLVHDGEHPLMRAARAWLLRQRLSPPTECE
jgi:hypothetical protein